MRAYDAALYLKAPNRRQAPVLEAVTRWPGKTATELTRKLGIMDPRDVNRRLPELERMAHVKRGPRRACQFTGRKAATWWPEEKAS